MGRRGIWRECDEWVGHNAEYATYLPKLALAGGSDYQHLWYVGGGNIEEMGLVADGASSRHLEELLEAIEPRMVPGCRLALGGFRISGEQFCRLLKRFSVVELHQCHIGRGWWNAGADHGCAELIVRKCTGVIPPRIQPGQISSRSLTVLRTYGFRRGLDWRMNTIIAGQPNELPEDRFAQYITTAVWGPQLREFMLFDIQSATFLTGLDPSMKMRTLWVEPVTAEVFDWVLRHRRVDSLELRWTPDVRPDFTRLSKLKRLRSLDVTNTPLNDEQLLDIRQSTKLGGIQTYYSKLTSASWPVILSWPGLASFWGSQELKGPVPDDLPETTELQEFVALNADTEWFRKLLARYPNVEVVQM